VQREERLLGRSCGLRPPQQPVLEQMQYGQREQMHMSRTTQHSAAIVIANTTYIPTDCGKNGQNVKAETQ
jgi:hypothetical protein